MQTIMYILGSDSHKAEHLGACIKEVRHLLKELGLQYFCTYEKQQPVFHRLYIPKLFDAFFRIDQSRNRQTGGTGLGLYIVKTILDLHGAEIKKTYSIQSRFKLE